MEKASNIFPEGADPGLKSVAMARGIFFSINCFTGENGIFKNKEQSGNTVAIVLQERMGFLKTKNKVAILWQLF